MTSYSTSPFLISSAAHNSLSDVPPIFCLWFLLLLMSVYISSSFVFLYVDFGWSSFLLPLVCLCNSTNFDIFSVVLIQWPSSVWVEWPKGELYSMLVRSWIFFFFSKSSFIIYFWISRSIKFQWNVQLL